MNRLLRRTAAALFVVAAALLVVGVSTEDSHSETGEAVHDETAEATGSDEATELAAGSESADDAGSGRTASLLNPSRIMTRRSGCLASTSNHPPPSRPR